jgi:hypothetical protein
MSVDGAFVPLLNKEWVEVKTLALGVVDEYENAKGEKVIQTRELSYFSRSSEASDFARESLVEVHRRGTEKARKVCAVTDGAAWEQGFIDYHRPDAVRILDFCHAAEYLAEAGRSLHGEQTQEFNQWYEAQRQNLKRGKPERVLSALRALRKTAEDEGKHLALESIQNSLSYLDKRREMIDYAKFQALGYPIGSGSVESANKVVVESRMKQAGMHWARRSVDPMLGLRNIACNDRWEEGWPQIQQQQRKQVEARRSERRERKLIKQQPKGIRAEIEQAQLGASNKAGRLIRNRVLESNEEKLAFGGAKQQKRPPADHPWRRMRFGRARYKPFLETRGAKS